MREVVKERDAAFGEADLNLRWTSTPPTRPRTTLAAQKKLLSKLADLAIACRSLVKDVDLVCKLSTRVVDTAEKDAAARDHDSWDSRASGRLAKELDARRKDAVEQLKFTAYFERQADWLLSRFPDAAFTAAPL